MDEQAVEKLAEHNCELILQGYWLKMSAQQKRDWLNGAREELAFIESLGYVLPVLGAERREKIALEICLATNPNAPDDYYDFLKSHTKEPQSVWAL